MTIGRDDAADIQVAHPMVSRLHAVVESTSDGWLLTNHSRNGVFLDGRRVHRLPIAAPTEVRLGESDIGVALKLMVPDRHSDLESFNGTYLNGQRIAQARIADGDVMGIGHSLLQLTGDRLVKYVDTGDVEFEVHNLVVTAADGQRLLNKVGFTLSSRSVLAVIGPTGAGKSTLLGALTGSQPAQNGSVRYGRTKSVSELR